ncbi:putative sulfate exporter family transporter [Micromonospora sp. NPDC006766]|uniref:YeiH family protein n=1 Tax=Micromonospora sp. NPDC006766 TaxID=3154778 RepID=UPI0033FB8D67
MVGAPVLAIVGGMLAGPLARRRRWAIDPGARFAGRYVLQAAIVIFGLGLSLAAVVRIGVSSLPVMLGTLAACFAVAALAGRALGVPADLRLLIGSGTGICGASAIGAIAPVIAAGEAAIGYAMSTIFVFNLLAVLIFPAVGHLLGLDAASFGLWAGTAINDTSSVVAAGYAYSRAAGDEAVAVKLVRALMIIPLVLAVALARHRAPAGDTGGCGVPVRPAAGPSGKERVAGRLRVSRLVPTFIPLFLLAAAVNTLGLVPDRARDGLGLAATVALAVAMAGIGLGISTGDLRRSGIRPLLLGGLLSLTVAVTGLGLQTLFM